MKSERTTTPEHISREIVADIRKFVAENGGSIRKVLESGALWVMSKGAKEYIQKLNKK